MAAVVLSAVKALEAVEARGRELGTSTVQRITWTPITDIGRAVVRVLTEEEPR